MFDWRFWAVLVIIVLIVLSNGHENKQFEQINTKLDTIATKVEVVPLPKPRPVVHKKPKPPLRICCPWVKPIDAQESPKR